MQKEEKFKELLKNIFQYNKDKIDLDFGVYRVFKHKENEIRNFIETKLPEYIEENLDGIEPTTIYNHTLEFFERYFQDGDFYPVPIYSTTKNHILRHNGEEVIFSWANKDQYYIKSIDNFSIYKIKHDNLYNDAFYTTNTQAVNFVVDEIDDTKGNNKSTRIFTLSTKSAEFVENEGFNIYIDYKNKSSDIVEVDENGLFEIISNAKINLTLEEIAHHLKKFKNLRKTDFFIHKRLEAFLKEELDYYLKTNILRDITTLSSVDIKTTQVVKKISEFIIKFIASLEELQKMLWEKKKFSYDVNYIITLDKLSKELLEEIVNHENFIKQIDEWKELKLISEFKNDELYDGLLDELKKECKYLPLDTKHFDEELKYKILESIENLDEATDGVLINSDNFHGLNFLQNRYKEKVKCVYIDPPYNTGDDGFPYKDHYQHSSWLSMMSDRLELSKEFLFDNASIMLSINEEELFNLKNLLDKVYLEQNYLTTATVKVRHDDRILKGDKSIHEVTEQLLFYRKSNIFEPSKRESDNTSIEEYIWEIKELETDPEVVFMDGKKVQVFSPNQYELIQGNANSKKLKKINIRGSLREGNSSGRFYVANIEPLFKSHRGYLFKVENIGADGLGYRYFQIPNDNVNRVNSDYFQGLPIDRNDIKYLPYPNLLDFESSFNKVGAEDGITFRNGKKPKEFIKHLLIVNGTTQNDNAIVLDFFGGSGSTFATIIDINRMKKNSYIKFLGIETNEYFDTILLKRIKNITYASSWKNGEPQDTNGTSQLIKYYRLEQYEDTLENSKLQSSSDTDSYIKALEPLKEYMSELYASKYLSLYKDFISRESKALLMDDSIFFNPFNFTLRVNIDSQIVEKKMDLVETFNTLKGIEVQGMKLRYLEDKKYIFVDGKNEVVIWREFDKESLDITKELEFIKENCTIEKELYINGITQTHTKKELVAKESIFELRALLVEGVKIDE
ncbi:site-specific DNA-methyltransferase [Aliarcobacter cryaerophilus]|uniref:site-specific DNA-methyltransferase n=1 Tax=Aliarcobacter cryaerophilus TaxID=28198 RepID=UPI001868FBA9|nr:site-specific DNA-methyltransferase [Aliarcobacter cryaerophilus]